jgi:hypothetical protein
MESVPNNVSAVSLEGGSLRSKYLITGAILANVMPLVAIFIPGLWALIGIYSLPLLLIERLFDFRNILVSNGTLPVPHTVGLFLTIPFWAAFGACIGYVTFRTQTKKGKARISLSQMVNRIGGSIVGLLFVGYIVFMLIAMLFYK